MHSSEETNLMKFFTFKINMTFAACVAYVVDVMHSQSSEIMAAITFVTFHFIKPFRFFLNELLDIALCMLFNVQ